MALRASYYGLKKKWAQKINNQNIIPDNAGSSNPLITDTQYKKAVNYDYKTGVKNILPSSPTKSKTENGITFTVGDDGSVDIHGTSTATALLRYDIVVEPGVYLLYGYIDSDTWVGMYNYSGNTYYVSTSTGEPPETSHIWNVVEKINRAGVTIRVGSGKTYNHKKIYPMLTYSTIPLDDASYYAYAKTNIELTNENIDQAGALSDHKTTINAIISAATGAEDFSAFKTAMTALTPLTRSTPAPAERSLQVEEPVGDTVKKTTRKTTKKEDI